MSKSDVIIVGAGPYGIAATSHLRTIKGLDVQTFGQPMSFWESNMPVGMFLRSNWTATEIASPNGELSLEQYIAASGNHFSHPVPIDCFVSYGLWYQRQAVPDLDRRRVVRIEPNSAGFHVRLSDGEVIHSRRVVVATGIGSFAWRPPEYANLPSELVSHASQHSDLRIFAGKSVLTVGGGQSSLESAALLHEGGASVEVVARTNQIHWLQGWTSKTLHHRMGKTIRRLLYAPTDVGPAVLSQLLARPDLLKHLPRGLKDKLRRRAVRPAGARWLVDRLKSVPIHLGTFITSVTVEGDKLKVRLNDGTGRTVDHILLGTGYRVDVSKYDFFAPELVEKIRRVNGYPVLRPGLETSVDGLHILGAPAVWSFGPLMQFVSGTHYASRSLLKCIAAKPANLPSDQRVEEPLPVA